MTEPLQPGYKESITSYTHLQANNGALRRAAQLMINSIAKLNNGEALADPNRKVIIA